MDNEIWKPVSGFEGYYEVSSLGRIRSVERYVKQADHLRYVKPKIKQITIGRGGYPSVTLCKNRRSRQYRIHRLVAEAFIPNPDNKPFVDHLNTDRTDFRIENLRWVDAGENARNPNTMAHCRENTYTKERTKKIHETTRARGTSNAPKTVYQYTKDGLFVKEYESLEEAGRQTSIYATSIRRALNDNSQSAGGYMWFSTKQESSPQYKRREHKKYKRILYYDKYGELKGVFGSLQEAERETGINRNNIVRNALLNSKPRRYKFKLE